MQNVSPVLPHIITREMPRIILGQKRNSKSRVYAAGGEVSMNIK
jgi:hypothetical protein